MTIYVCRVGDLDYTIYDFINELNLGYSEFTDMNALEIYIKNHITDEEDALLYPTKTPFEKGINNIILFVIDTDKEETFYIKVIFEDIKFLRVKKD